MSQLAFDDLSDDAVLDVVRAAVNVFGWHEVDRALRQIGHATSVPSAPARPSDPETSHRAAKQEPDLSRFSERSRQAKLLRAFAVGPLTHQQAAARVVGATAAISAFEGCRRRCSDLRAAGYIYDTGHRRKNAGSDDESVVWAINDAGVAALKRLDATGWSR